MKIVLQRVARASVRVGDERIAGIEAGLLLLVGFGHNDLAPPLARAASRVANLRVFSDTSGKLQHSLLETGGEILAVPQFTLYGNTAKGRRPDFTSALAPEQARALFEEFVESLAATGVQRVASGRFGAAMSVSLINDGPLTLILEY